MATNKRLQVSELDFNQIKDNLKDFLRSQNTLQDYDFEGSAVNTILDLMAYVTHYNAINANIGINETFLETAQYRGSVVGHARQLSYTPKSLKGAKAVVDITLNGVVDELITLNKNHKFTTVIDNVSYTFLTTDSYQSTNGIFSSVELQEGVSRSVSYIFDTASSENFVIPELNVDTDTLEVRVYATESSETFEIYTLAKNIIGVTGESKAFFLNESFDGRYEVTFGDGVIGKALTDGNLIELHYYVCSGEEANGASSFRTGDSIGGYSSMTITTLQPSAGGAQKEPIRQIKYRAPLAYSAQNRAVTSDDYKAIILENYSNIDSISVWGGEDNDPPVYGKVFISIKPAGSELLTDQQKEFIFDNIIKPRVVVGITPEFVDPEYTYVSLEVFYKYNESETSLTVNNLSNIVRNAISNYNDLNLKTADGVLRYSSLLSQIDQSNEAITNSIARVYLKKRFVPVIGSTNVEYELRYSSPIYSGSSEKGVIYRSSIFTYDGEQCTLQDYVNSVGQRRLRIVRGAGVNQTTVAGDVGYIDEQAGKIVIFKGFNPSAFIGEYIEITVISDSNDVAPNKNNLVSIDIDDVYITGTPDRTTSGSDAAGKNYSLISRHAN